jgi:hypothetical protein
VNLEEALEVQVGDLLAILHAEELGELGVGDDAALEVRVEAVVSLHIRRHKLGHISLGALALRGQAHEAGELIGDGAELEERVVRATSLPGSLLLGSHVSRVLAAALLGVASLTLERLGRLNRLVDSRADAGGDIGAESLEGLLESREDRIGGADLDRGSISNRGRGRRGHRNGNLGLCGGLATLGRGRGRGRGGLNGGSGSRGLGLLISRHVYITSRLNGGHF